VTDEERSKPQKLLITVEMTSDFTAAIMSDRVEKTIDYHDVCQEILHFGEGRSWKLIEKLAANLVDMILTRFKPHDVTVEVKKFVIPQARYVSVMFGRSRL